MFQPSVPVQLEPGEAVVRTMRRHGIILLGRILPPLVILLAPVFLIVWSLLTRSRDPVAARVTIDLSVNVLLVLIIPLAIWAIINAYDWLNDSFHVTTRRVIRLERHGIVHQEDLLQARLESIQNVAVRVPDPLAHSFGYGTVIIETAAQGTSIEFDSIPHPHDVQQIIQDVRGAPLPEKNEPAPAPSQPDAAPSRTFYIFPPNPLIAPNGVITWHKHWIVLVSALAAPSVLLSIFLALWWLTRWTVVFLPLSLMMLLGMIFQYVNWWNDIYILTRDRIIDIERVPLIKEDRREAFLEQIQDVRLDTPNVFWRALHLGNVTIETAGRAESAFTFAAVPDPAWVQQIIMTRKKESHLWSSDWEAGQIVQRILRNQYQDTPRGSSPPAGRV